MYLSSIVMPTFSKFILGTRSSQQLLDTDGYTYNKRNDRTASNGFTIWRCSKTRSLKCGCSVNLNPADHALTPSKDHNHAAAPQLEQKKELITSLKRKAEDQQLSSTQNILTETLKSSSPELNVQLPKLESLARVAQRARAKASGSANHSEALKSTDFELPPTCQYTLRDEDFVAFDGVTDKGARLIIFTTARNLRILASHPNWIADGTFYVSPKQFYQSYSIHAVIDGKCLPLLFAILSDKTQDTYVFMLNIIKGLLCDIESGIIMLDFEIAAMNAFRQVFEKFEVMNCYFHLCQSIQRRIQKSFKVLYRKDKAFARASRLVAFLAFVPLEHIESAFEALSMHIAGIYPQLMQIVNYFEQYYLGLAQPDGTRACTKYSIEHWNHYAMVLVDPEYPRTSNMVEGFHLGFKSKVNRPKPSVQEYFRAIRDQQVTTDYHLDRLANGMTPAKKRKTNNHLLYKICLDFEEYESVLEYMFEVAKYFGHDV